VSVDHSVLLSCFSADSVLLTENTWLYQTFFCTARSAVLDKYNDMKASLDTLTKPEIINDFLPDAVAAQIPPTPCWMRLDIILGIS